MKRVRYLRAGLGSMCALLNRVLPACWFQVQLSRGDLMARVGRQRTAIRKGA